MSGGGQGRIRVCERVMRGRGRSLRRVVDTRLGVLLLVWRKVVLGESGVNLVFQVLKPVRAKVYDGFRFVSPQLGRVREVVIWR